MFSIELAITPKVEKNAACLSLGITCVDIGSALRPNFSHTYSSMKGSIFANVPTAPEIAPVAISLFAVYKRPLFLFISA